MPFPDLLELDASDFTSPRDVAGWVRDERQALLQRIHASGALLLRGLPLERAADFDLVVQAFDLGRFSYRESLSNAVRVDLTDRVFTANEAPPAATIRLHHELAQTPAHPRHLLFFCEHQASRGGATALCRSDAVFEAVARAHPAFSRALENHGLRYHHVMPGEDDATSSMGRSWRNTLDVSGRAEAERKLDTLGYTFTWRGEDLAVTSPRLRAIVLLDDGRRTFFNQLVATRSWKDARNDPDSAVELGNGESIPIPLRDEIAEITDALALDLEWRMGDLALLDNHLVQHGRRPFEGARRVLVAFGARAEYAAELA